MLGKMLTPQISTLQKALILGLRLVRRNRRNAGKYMVLGRMLTRGFGNSENHGGIKENI